LFDKEKEKQFFLLPSLSSVYFSIQM